VDLDDDACQIVMDRYHLATKRDAVNFALRTVAAEPLDLDRARALRGSGWEGDLDILRSDRVP
jgi:Arc/MetJ family transcription regulator